MLIESLLFTASLIFTSDISSPLKINETHDDIHLLHPGQFHGDEVIANAEQLDWYGLFINDTGSYIEKTKIKIDTIYDVILDEDSTIKSGKFISIENEDRCIILISGLKLIEGSVDAIVPSKYYLDPGEKMEFTLSNQTYFFEASGIKSDTIFQEWRDITDYKLFFNKNNDPSKKQLLMSEEYLEGSIGGIIWIGDLNRDKKPDLIMNLSNHYNRGNTTLLISGDSENGDLVKKVAEWNTTGC